jgi:hypothetical protein
MSAQYQHPIEKRQPQAERPRQSSAAKRYPIKGAKLCTGMILLRRQNKVPDDLWEGCLAYHVWQPRNPLNGPPSTDSTIYTIFKNVKTEM